ncbi:ubiquitin carboxyl-terminal hydrolase [Scheffersomyces xylosifermentans]|uniref:ubiquitin carboxyl-terminal hydrolase n=1 Tax=Scheffersomyces xylosifermentans TaxID=1304137 RepID=UPI00315D5CF2
MISENAARNDSMDIDKKEVIEIDSDYESERTKRSNKNNTTPNAHNVSNHTEIEPEEELEEVDDDDDDLDENDEDDDDSEDIVEISTKKSATNSNNSVIPPANDFAATAKRLMKPIPDYPVAAEAHYVWEINDWNGLKEDKVRSPTFRCGDFEWNILLFPRGNAHNNAVSLYMEPHPIAGEDGEISDDWYVCAQFGLDIWNPNHPESHLPSGSSHRFNKNETDWGFSSLIDAKQLVSTNNSRIGNQPHAILENNKVNITGYVRIIDDSSTGVLWHSFVDYDSKKSTGFVGLNNQGATCYLNSLLQSYFTTLNFRKLVYQIPTNSTPSSKPSVALSLQRIFYLLSTSKEPVGTLELTKSFGWDSSDAFTQHDVQELNRILMDKLETAMKGSEIENSLNDIFVGKMKSYIRCVHVPYESSRVEDFWDIQLNVKGFKNLQESFANYIEIEMLEGENKYQAGDEHGYQDAKKGVVFESFPPVLHLQLKRFEYDFMVDDLVKIDDFYEFPDSIDLRPYLDEELPKEVLDQNWTYNLHGVLVHQGSISNGHYYAMIKPQARNDTWLRFDDDKVWKVTKGQVFKENFGANEVSAEEFAKMSRLEQQENLIRRVTSAYMLVYYRESLLDKVLPNGEEDITSVIPDHIPNQIKYEIEERERLERLKQEALYYTNVKFITTNTINSYSGFDLALDPTLPKFYDESLVGTDSEPLTFKVKKDDPFLSLNKLIGKQLGYITEDKDGENADMNVDSDELPFRLIATCHRNNHTNRTDTEVVEELKDATINSVFFKAFNRKYDEMVFYVEEINKDLRNVTKIVPPSSNPVDPKDFSFDVVFDKLKKIGTTVSPEFKFSGIFDYSNHILIFVKYFDPISQQVRGLSHIVVSKDDIIGTIVEPVNKFLDFDPHLQLDLFEELSPTKIEKIDPALTFEKHELSNGDIITVQVHNASELAGERKFRDAKEYYTFLLTRMHIVVKPFKAEIDEEDSDFVADENDESPIAPSVGNGNNTNGSKAIPKDLIKGQDAQDFPSDDEVTAKQIETAKQISKSFSLWISTTYSYQDLASEIASRLDSSVDPSFLRIFVLNNQRQRYPLKTSHHLGSFFPKTVPVNQTVQFEYEILNIKLRDYENLKSVKIHWLHSLLQYQVFELLVPKNGLVVDLINKLLHKVHVPKKDLKHILVWSGSNHTYLDLVKFDKPIDQIQDGVDLYAGVFPAEVEILSSHDMFKRFVNEPVDLNEFDNDFLKEEYVTSKKLSKNLNLIPAFHFYKNSTYHHGVPFILAVYPDEKFPETKERLRRKLGLGIQAFEKMRFALADSHDKGVYIDHENSDLVLFNEIGKAQSAISFALDHPDRNPRRQGQFDKGISIK